MHEQEGTIQLPAAAKCPKMDTVLQQLAESYPLAHAHAAQKLMYLWREYVLQ